MKTDLTLLLKELQELAEALPGKDKLLVKQYRKGLSYQLLVGGIVQSTVPVQSSALATALQQASVQGILEGAAYTAFRENFNGFRLHVKAMALYEELRYNQPEAQPVFQKSQVA